MLNQRRFVVSTERMIKSTSLTMYKPHLKAITFVLIEIIIPVIKKNPTGRLVL